MKYFLLVACFSFSLISQAWGPTGHRVVGAIAQKHLDKEVLEKALVLLSGESLARVSNWPDKIKSDPKNYAYTYKWHYTDWPKDQEKYNRKTANGSLIQAIEDNQRALRDKSLSKKKRAFALTFLVHLVGDLHMPLHIGNGLDKGGNQCFVFYHGKKTRLHELWDEELIDFTNLSFSEYADFLDIASKSKIKKIQMGKPIIWAKESKILREQIYPKELPGFEDHIVDPRLPAYCQKTITLPNEDLPQLSYEYAYMFLPKLEQRLLQGGLRLAKIINEALK